LWLGKSYARKKLEQGLGLDSRGPALFPLDSTPQAENGKPLPRSAAPMKAIL